MVTILTLFMVTLKSKFDYTVVALERINYCILTPLLPFFAVLDVSRHPFGSVSIRVLTAIYIISNSLGIIIL